MDSLKQNVTNYVLPSICFVGFFTNLIVVKVFSNRDAFKHEIYGYLRVHSIVQVFYLAFSCIYFLLQRYCPGTYFTISYQLIIQLYLTSALSVFLIFIEIIITIRRLLMLFNLNSTLNISFRMTLLIYFTLAMLLHLSIIFSFKVGRVDTSSQNASQIDSSSLICSSRSVYKLSNERLMRVGLNQALLKLIGTLRAFMLPPILLVSNLIILIEFRKSVAKRKLIASKLLLFLISSFKSFSIQL